MKRAGLNQNVSQGLLTFHQVEFGNNCLGSLHGSKPFCQAAHHVVLVVESSCLGGLCVEN
jgi:hypothetical protein